MGEKASETLTVIEDLKSGEVRITVVTPQLDKGSIFTLNEKKKVIEKSSKSR